MAGTLGRSGIYMSRVDGLNLELYFPRCHVIVIGGGYRLNQT